MSVLEDVSGPQRNVKGNNMLCNVGFPLPPSVMNHKFVDISRKREIAGINFSRKRDNSTQAIESNLPDKKIKFTVGIINQNQFPRVKHIQYPQYPPLKKQIKISNSKVEMSTKNRNK